MPKDEAFDMPAGVRAIVEQSMQQARSAFDAWLTATLHAVNAAQTQAITAQAGVREISELAARYAERNIAASFQFAQRLVQAKDPKEIADLHSEYVKEQMQALSEQAKDLSERAVKLSPAKNS